MGQPRDENQIAGYTRSDLNGALSDPGSTPGASTKPNDLAEGVGRRTRVRDPGPILGPYAARRRLGVALFGPIRNAFKTET